MTTDLHRSEEQEPSGGKSPPSSEAVASPRVVIGAVLGSSPFSNCVIVNVPGRPPRPALIGGDLGGVALGCRPTCGIPHGSQVVILEMAGLDFDYVLATIPQLVTDPRLSPSDLLQQAAGSHSFLEAVHSLPLLQLTGMLNGSQGTLADVLTGEWARTNEFGLGLAVERFAAWLRVDEMCGIWASFTNRLVRLAAETFRKETLGSEEFESFADGEFNRVLQRAVTPSEAVGMPATAAGERQLPVDQFLVTDLTKAKFGTETDDAGIVSVVEPAVADLVMAPRLIEHEGRQAFVKQTTVALPNPELTQYTRDQVDRQIGLLRQRFGIDGSYLLESLASISLRKVVSIPVPTEIKDPFDAKEIEEPVHILDFTFDTEQFQQAAVVAQALEAHAYLSNVESLRNWLGRDDYAVPEGGDALLVPDSSAELPRTQNVADLWMPLPQSVSRSVHPDAPDGKTYYHATAGVDVLDDGSVVIRDAYGSEIVMSGGNIFQRPALDLYQTPGRNAVSWVPGDIIQRAGRDVDISSDYSNVRIKAERNLQALGGNGGTGGVLIESKGENAEITPDPGEAAVFSGVIVKSQRNVTAVGEEVALKSAGDSPTGLHFDAGDGTLSVLGSSAVLDIDSQIALRIGDTDSLLTEDAISLGAQNLFLNGDVVMQGQAIIRSSVIVEQGDLLVGGALLSTRFLVTNEGVFTGGQVIGESLGEGRLEPSRPQEDGETNDEYLSGQTNRLVNVPDLTSLTLVTETLAAASELLDTSLDLLAERQAVFDDVQPQIGFSFRLDDDYLFGHDGFFLPEAEWQQRARLGGDVNTWDSVGVELPETEVVTAPHPGQDTWQDANRGSFVRSGSGVFINPLTGVVTGRDTSASPTTTLQGQSFRSSYPVAVPGLFSNQ